MMSPIVQCWDPSTRKNFVICFNCHCVLVHVEESSLVACLLRIYYAWLTIFKIGSATMKLLCITPFTETMATAKYV